MKQRGDVWWINFDPSVGQEVKKKRPAIVISNNTSNKHLKRYQVVPLSTQTGKFYPSETPVKLAGKESKAMADQLTTVSELRFINRAGSITQDELTEVERIVKLQLGLK
ncbi:MAG: type II toxin-antitoxin system PemK/MazF family toxin [Tunicatimonas sp.]